MNFRGRRLENNQNLTQIRRSQNFVRTQTGRLRDKSIYKLKSSNCGLVMNSYFNDNLEDTQFFSLDSFSSKAIPFFFPVFSFSVECVSWYLVGRPAVGLQKKKTKNKSQEVSEQEALAPQQWRYVAMLVLCSFFKLKNYF